MLISPLLEQKALTLIFVAIGIGIIGVGFGMLRSKEWLQLHRWTMTGVLALSLAAILVVMIPSLYMFYSDPNVAWFSPFSMLQIAHGVVGVPAIVMAFQFSLGRLPKNMRKWMVANAALWIVGAALGAVVYLTMPISRNRTHLAKPSGLISGSIRLTSRFHECHAPGAALKIELLVDLTTS